MRLRKIVYAALIIITTVLAPYPLHAGYYPSTVWRTVRTEHFTIYYPKGHEAFAQRVLDMSDEVYDDVVGYLGITPRRTPLVLHPFTDSLNGFYQPFPNRISLFETPPTDFKYFGSTLSDIIDAVYTHEMGHLVHMTSRRGWFGFLSRIAGEGLALSNAWSPGWIIEGVTTNLETEFTDGGRGRSPLFKSTVLGFARDDNVWSMSASGTESRYVPPRGRIYHSGLFMVDYLNDAKGENAIARLIQYQSAHPLGGTRKALNKVYGASPLAFYKDYRNSLKATADSLWLVSNNNGLPPGRTLVSHELDGYDNHFWTSRGSIIALRRGYSKKRALIEIDPQTGETVSETPTGILMSKPAARSVDGKIIFGELFYHPLGEGDLDVSDLVLFDPATKKHERITRSAHIFSADLSPDGTTFIAVQRNGMWTDLVLIDRDGSDIRPLVDGEGMYFAAPCWSPDGKTIAVTVKNGAFTDIALIDPVDGSLCTMFASDMHGDGDPSFSPDGRWIVFTSCRDGQWNIHAWDTVTSKLFQLTSSFHPALEPRISPDGSLLSFLEQNRSLNEIRILPFEPASGKELEVAPGHQLYAPEKKHTLSAEPLESTGIPLWEAYKPFIHAPYASSDEHGTTAGLFLAGNDPVNRNTYLASLLYGPESGRFGYDITLQNSSFWPRAAFRTYDSSIKSTILRDDTSYWYRERGSEASLGLNIIHRAVPSILRSNTVIGARMRQFLSIDDADNYHRFSEDSDMSTSVFGSITVEQVPDYAPRDMVPGWSRLMVLSHEKALDSFGGELPGHNSFAAFRHTVPSPLRHHGFELSLYYHSRHGRLRYSNSYAYPRGYSSGDEKGGFNLDKACTVSLEYRFPLLYTDRGLGVNFLHFSGVRGSFFADHGAGWQGSFDRDIWASAVRTSLGATLTTQFYLFSFIPVEAGIAHGYKVIDDERFTEFIVITDVLEFDMNRFSRRTIIPEFRSSRLIRFMRNGARLR